MRDLCYVRSERIRSKKECIVCKEVSLSDKMDVSTPKPAVVPKTQAVADIMNNTQMRAEEFKMQIEDNLLSNPRVKGEEFIPQPQAARHYYGRHGDARLKEEEIMAKIMEDIT